MRTDDTCDLDQLLKLRLLIARFGEMDQARWWNTRGLLGPLGEMALKRGFPKTHLLAQARLVFTVAAHRCREVFDPPGSITLWKLPAELEDRFEAEWSRWIEHADDWKTFASELRAPKSTDLLAEARRLELADDGIVDEARQLSAPRKIALCQFQESTDQTTASWPCLHLASSEASLAHPRSPARLGV